MAKVKVVMNSAGAREVMNSAGVQAFLLEQASAIRQRADSIGSGKYKADVQAGQNRAHARVSTTDIESMASNRKHNTLLKCMRG